MADFYVFGSEDEGGDFVGGFSEISEPNAYSFAPVVDATLSTVYYGTALLSGATVGALMEASAGEVSNDGGETWSASCDFVPGSTYARATLTSSGFYLTETTTTVTVNGVSATYSVTTAVAALLGIPEPSTDEYYHYIEGRMRVFLASAPPVQRSIQVIEVRNSDLPQTYFLWKEPYVGQVTLDDESIVNVTPLNMDVKIAGNEAHLDQKFDVIFDTTDINDEFREALDGIPLDTTERIVMVYREYLSDDLTTPQITVSLQIEAIVYNKGVARFSAVSPRLNVTRTGQLYTFRQFPMLRAFS